MTVRAVELLSHTPELQVEERDKLKTNHTIYSGGFICMLLTLYHMYYRVDHPYVARVDM